MMLSRIGNQLGTAAKYFMRSSQEAQLTTQKVTHADEWEVVEKVTDMETGKALQPCYFNSMPDDALCEILSFLSPTDLEKFSRTNNKSHELVHLNSFWEHFFKNPDQIYLRVHPESEETYTVQCGPGEVRNHFIRNPALRKPEYIELGKNGKKFISESIKYGVLIERDHKIFFVKDKRSWLLGKRNMDTEIMEKIRCGELVPAPIVKYMFSFFNKEQDYLFANSGIQDRFKENSLPLEPHFPLTFTQRYALNQGIIGFCMKHSDLSLEQLLQLGWSQIGAMDVPETRPRIEKGDLTVEQALSLDIGILPEEK